ncbi:hypothetical protein [Fluviicola taffensis]|uniref:Lipoprotein n=1 Tax=Fluviicola taffensis (strain DSM 16823 / NCIMB 13979 / RW262) TaxID=755732 RepID=F2IG26_FLUTR|nr:hypothetical protein [Fluviicola taffensis]AEA44661.1 hypothetical protein Fluta_2680 [Fluviicola taffensis DSM 16823]
MKKIKATLIAILLGTSFILSSCGESTKEKALKSAETADPKAGDPVKAEEKSDYLIENKILHSFSDPSKKDEFRIVITGENLLKGKVLFTITNSEGKNLLKEEFDAEMLLGYDFMGDINSQKETDAFIQKRINSFFAKDKFSIPAIEDEILFEDQSYYIDKETWTEIKSDKQTIGFYYLLGKEDGRHIAFSKKKGKVVMFYNCC